MSLVGGAMNAEDFFFASSSVVKVGYVCFTSSSAVKAEVVFFTLVHCSFTCKCLDLTFLLFSYLTWHVSLLTLAGCCFPFLMLLVVGAVNVGAIFFTSLGAVNE